MRARVAFFRESAREIARDIACGNEAACAAFAPRSIARATESYRATSSIAPAVRLTMPQNQPGRISQETIL